jgi:hypothetical protein
LRRVKAMRCDPQDSVVLPAACVRCACVRRRLACILSACLVRCRLVCILSECTQRCLACDGRLGRRSKTCSKWRRRRGRIGLLSRVLYFDIVLTTTAPTSFSRAFLTIILPIPVVMTLLLAMSLESALARSRLPFVPKMAEINSVFETGGRNRLLGLACRGQAAMTCQWCVV